jgi:hypothetical protein
MIISLIQALAFLLISIFDLHKRHKKYKANGHEVYFKTSYGFSTLFIPIPLWIFSIFATGLFFIKFINSN